MSDNLLSLPEPIGIPVQGETGTYPVGRIFCVGRNYAAHAAEMGNEVDREAPFYFTKTPENAVLTGASVPYPPGTENYHHEMELVLAIGAPVFRATRKEALGAMYALGCGLDMTRRDLQIASREKQRPWDLGKDVEGAGVFGALTPIGALGDIGAQRIWLDVNGERRQERGKLVLGGEKQGCQRRREKAVNGEVIPLQDVATGCGDDCPRCQFRFLFGHCIPLDKDPDAFHPRIGNRRTIVAALKFWMKSGCGRI